MSLNPRQRLARDVVRATVAATVTAWIPDQTRALLVWLSPSDPPHTFPAILGLTVMGFLGNSLLLTASLLPICLAIASALTSRSMMQPRAAFTAAIVVAAAACGASLVPSALLQREQFSRILARHLPMFSDSVLFSLAWFVVFERCSRQPPSATTLQQGLSRRAHLALVLTTVWTLGLAFLGGFILDFGGDGEYRLQTTVDSPKGLMRICLVDYLERGGALRSVREEAYLIRSNDSWAPNHRGLLVWRSRHVSVVRAQWTSEREVRLFVKEQRPGSADANTKEYARDGFLVTTFTDDGQRVRGMH
jgi:hypothetical protein